MSLKTITEQNSKLICDICGEEIDKSDSRDTLNITIQTSWWQTFGFKHYDICKKHKKSFINWIKEQTNSREKRN